MEKKSLTYLNELLSIHHDATFIYYAMIEHQIELRKLGNETGLKDFEDGMWAGSAISGGIKNPIDADKNGVQVSVEFRMGMIAGLSIGINTQGLGKIIHDSSEGRTNKTYLAIYAKSITRYLRTIHTRTMNFIESHKHQF